MTPAHAAANPYFARYLDGDYWLVIELAGAVITAFGADWCFLLARTSRGERKQQGLTIFLLPILGMLSKSVENREVAARTTSSSSCRW